MVGSGKKYLHLAALPTQSVWEAGCVSEAQRLIKLRIRQKVDMCSSAARTAKALHCGREEQKKKKKVQNERWRLDVQKTQRRKKTLQEESPAGVSRQSHTEQSVILNHELWDQITNGHLFKGNKGRASTARYQNSFY